ncbi:FecCD family ABC transporter permease [Kitasatospora aureofaciens]|uniref:FecCD family ABC transporter permease n=1 Tax=Kitasatospora aureofaciens TaxID=1894 RepID=UPI0036F48932
MVTPTATAPSRDTGGGSTATPPPALRRTLALAGLTLAVLALLVTAVVVGPVTIPLDDTVRVLTGYRPSDPRWTLIIETIRLPRVCTAALVGAGLGAAGVQMQTLFRNALADPFSLGVSSGASLGVAAVVATGGGAAGGFTAGGFTAGLAAQGRIGVVIASALGAAAVLALVLLLARWVRTPVTLLVIGVMLGSAATALVSVMLVYTSPERAQQFVQWGLGSFSATTWSDLRILAPITGAGVLCALFGVKSLNALLLGENYARTMGLNVRRTRTLTLLSVSILAGAATAFCGPIAFLGLAVPHLARTAVGTSDHRVLLPASLLTGAALALACSIASQPPGTDAALPVNAVTSLIGAPVVITVLVRSRRSLQGAT